MTTITNDYLTGPQLPVRLVRFQPDHFSFTLALFGFANQRHSCDRPLHTHTACVLAGQLPRRVENCEIAAKCVKESLPSPPYQPHPLSIVSALQAIDWDAKSSAVWAQWARKQMQTSVVLAHIDLRGNLRVSKFQKFQSGGATCQLLPSCCVLTHAMHCKFVI